MEYQSDHKPTSNYVSVNTLIGPRKPAPKTEPAPIPPDIARAEVITGQITPDEPMTAAPLAADIPRQESSPAPVVAETTSAGTDPAGPLPSVAGDFQLNEGEVLKAEQAVQSDQESEPVQSKTIPAVAAEGAGAVDPEPGSKNGSSSQGEVLPEGIRTRMEPALGADFHDVRLHHDGQAAAVAGQLGARAFTRGDDIYFGRDQYQPETAAGQHLIGHELAHVRQQKTISGLQYQLQIPDQRDRYEAEADALADRVVRGTDRNYAKSGNRQSPVQGVPGEIQLAEGEKGSNWILAKVGGLLRNIPGYALLVLVIGSDPLTGQAVGRDGVTLLRALLGLIPGGNLFVERLEEARVISRAVTWFTQGFQKLNINFTTVKNLFSQAWNGLSALDLLNPGGAFEKIKTIFLSPIRRLTGFVATAGPKLMEFIFEGAMALAGASAQKIIGLLNQGQGVLQQIISDPAGFLRNLINAIRGGLTNFVSHSGAHLQNGLAGWLFGTLNKAGIILPEKLNLAGIFSLTAQILGVTWQAIRTQVVKRIGPLAEKVMAHVEKGVAFVGRLITQGPLALLEMAKEFLGELQTLFFNTFIEWLRNTIIVKAVQKLLSMFNPVGALIQAVIAIYNTIQFFIERARQIGALVSAIINSIAEIAGGNLTKAIVAVEDSLAKALPVAISFLANVVGIGGMAAKIKEIITRIRQPIDQVVGKVVGFVAGKAKTLIARIGGGDKAKEEPPKNEAEHDAQVRAGLVALDNEQRNADQNRNGALTATEAEAAAQKVKSVYPVFKSLIPVAKDERWVFKYVASPEKEQIGLRVEHSSEHEAEADKDKQDQTVEETAKTGVSSVIKEVPTVRSGKFNEWFNKLTPDELDTIWQNKSMRRAIERELRVPGGMHEWHMVSRAPTFKRMGVSAEQIRNLRTAISDVEFVNPEGAHGKLGSTTAHNEILGIIDSSKNYNIFLHKLNDWASERLKGGIEALPEALKIK